MVMEDTGGMDLWSYGGYGLGISSAELQDLYVFRGLVDGFVTPGGAGSPPRTPPAYNPSLLPGNNRGKNGKSNFRTFRNKPSRFEIKTC